MVGMKQRKLVPGGIPEVYPGLRWTCNVCVGTNIDVKIIMDLRNKENKLLIPKYHKPPMIPELLIIPLHNRLWFCRKCAHPALLRHPRYYIIENENAERPYYTHHFRFGK